MQRKNVNLPHDRAADGKRVNVPRAAELLGCSRSWVYRLVEDGRLKAYRIGSRKGLQITERSIRAYLESRMVAMSDLASYLDSEA